MFCLYGVVPSSGGCSPPCGICVCYVGSPSIGFRGLLFVLGGLFALDGGGASAHSGYPLPLRALWTCATCVDVRLISCLQLR